MKSLQIASILVVSALTVFACGDDDDTRPVGNAGSLGEAGGEGGSGGNSAAGQTAVGGSGAGESSGGNGGGAGESSGNAGAFPGGAGGQGEGGTGGAAEPPPCVNDVEVIGDGGAGGGGGAGGAGPEALEPAILGTWKESFGGSLEITATHWNEGTIQAWDNAANVVITQNSSCALFNPRAFSKYVYTTPENDSFYYCTIVYDAATLAQAKADTKVADANDLDGAGCSGFPWSKVSKQ